ncbi:hypothetical protein [Microbacterium karelineae]|uniref:hypothetical protein n=1 Tax=Microbacterium karelineae TaxID=2654283 RepID=UPI0012EAF1E4|nr:hypothetical protein [Microbacterium karelineae]
MATEQRSEPTHGTAPWTHEHGWATESAHRTSEGVVVYVRCETCGRRRVDRRDQLAMPPSALSALVPTTRSAITASSA